MTPDDFHKIALPLYAACALVLLIMAICAVALKRDGDRERGRREDAGRDKPSSR
jgi:hypothetical protein